MLYLSVCRDVDKKGFIDPIRTLTMAQLKQEPTDRSRTPTGKDVHLHRLYLDPLSKARLGNTQVHCLIDIIQFNCSFSFATQGLFVVITVLVITSFRLD